ncbi:GNAT family N-acetyltransferase [Mobilitalea sibirica]|nr:GNAT family N-acetyltransferase [Mobilitalea sibirica]
MNELHKLEKKDIEQCADRVAKAFYDYPMFQHILGDRLNHENIKSVLSFLMNFSCLYAKAYTVTQELEEVILFTDYKNYKFSLIRSLRSGGLSLMKMGSDVGQRFNSFDRFTQDIHKNCMKDREHQYIILLGVNPDKQGQGYGSKLIKHALAVAKEKGQPSYLETHGEKNVAYYKKLGFKVISEDILPGTDILQYAMLYE